MGALMLALAGLTGAGLIFAGMCLAGDTPDLHDVFEETE
ncbi:hypothetical protein FHR32_005084 [Streptosporangium album]|uniref:Uncharacterized protein n=1 Tax=Streptosporangium album TaxID=47479 RepID=A0A7W7WAR4_9ACTN|nr:hypothetical protein [Streptosporangium album]